MVVKRPTFADLSRAQHTDAWAAVRVEAVGLVPVVHTRIDYEDAAGRRFTFGADGRRRWLDERESAGG